MKYKNTKVAILVPMLIALSVVVGMFIARLVWTDSPSFVNSESKIDDVMKLIDMYYVDELSPDSIEDVMISDFLHNLDPHSSYMTARKPWKWNRTYGKLCRNRNTILCLTRYRTDYQHNPWWSIGKGWTYGWRQDYQC